MTSKPIVSRSCSFYSSGMGNARAVGRIKLAKSFDLTLQRQPQVGLESMKSLCVYHCNKNLYIKAIVIGIFYGTTKERQLRDRQDIYDYMMGQTRMLLAMCPRPLLGRLGGQCQAGWACTGCKTVDTMTKYSGLIFKSII